MDTNILKTFEKALERKIRYKKGGRKMEYYKIAGFGESLKILKEVLTEEEFRGFCKGNILKYRLRAGKKTKSCDEDIKKLYIMKRY